MRAQRVDMGRGITRPRGAALLQRWAQQESAALPDAQRLRSCSRRRCALEAAPAHRAGRYDLLKR
jgi:hypothetical protein